MKKRRFGRHEGRDVSEITLQSADAALSILNYGCVLRDWRVDALGRGLPVTLGFRDFEAYDKHARSHGIVAGRVANRTAGARFELNGRSYQLSRNEGEHHLHGGVVGLGRRLWEMDGDTAAEAAVLRYHSPDGEEGYPGAVDFTVTFRLDGPRLVVEMHGLPDRPTPINLAQHSYWNLGGGGDVLDHEVWIDAPEHTPVGPDLIPDGTIRPVEGTHLDFTRPRTIGESDPDRIGLDDNLVLRADRDPAVPSVRVRCPRSGLKLQLWTGEPGLQVFDAAKMTIVAPGHDGQIYGPYAGLCLEAQHFPDSMHNPDWPSIVRAPEKPYFQRYTVEIVPD